MWQAIPHVSNSVAKKCCASTIVKLVFTVFIFVSENNTDSISSIVSDASVAVATADETNTGVPVAFLNTTLINSRRKHYRPLIVLLFLTRSNAVRSLRAAWQTWLRNTLRFFFCCIATKFRFPLPELTARVDGWPVSINRQHGPCFH